MVSFFKSTQCYLSFLSHNGLRMVHGCRVGPFLGAVHRMDDGSGVVLVHNVTVGYTWRYGIAASITMASYTVGCIVTWETLGHDGETKPRAHLGV